MFLKGMSFGCEHYPINCPEFEEWKLAQIERHKPNFIVLHGDMFDGLAATRWDKHPKQDWTVAKEFEKVSAYIDKINKAAPKAKKVFLYGNHDSNLFHEPNRMDENLRALILMNWHQIQTGKMADWVFPTERYKHNAYYRIGQITFQHGGNTGKAQTHSHLHKQGVEYGVPYGLHISAHTHAPVEVSQMRWLDQYLPYWVANVGTGADWDQMFYMDRSSMSLWGRAIVLFEVSKNSALKSNSAYTKPQWSAETIFHSFANGNRRV